MKSEKKLKKCLTNQFEYDILLRHSSERGKFNDMRVCWNWQTGTFEGRVLHDVRVQVPSLAPI